PPGRGRAQARGQGQPRDPHRPRRREHPGQPVAAARAGRSGVERRGRHGQEICRCRPRVAISDGATAEWGLSGDQDRGAAGGGTMREVLLPIGLPSAVGSLPHRDGDDAIAFVLDRQPRLPAAPTLPRRAAVEGMIPQAAWGIAGVLLLPDGSLLVDEAAVDPDLPLGDGLDAEPFAGLRAFLAAIEGRVAPFKLQLTGPVTLGLALHAVGVPTGRAFPVAAKAVATRTREVLQATREAAPGATPLVFLDEPGLTAALDPGFPLGVDDTVDLVSSALAQVE